MGETNKRAMAVSVIVPVFNELKTIRAIIGKIRETMLVDEIIVVDDCSTDGTSEAIREEGNAIRVYRHAKNLGKGAAVRTGIQYASGDIIIIQDADLEYDPGEYKYLLEPILSGMADVVYGSRMSGGKTQRVYMFWHKVGNSFLTFLTNLLYNTTLTDMETGYKVFKKEVISGMKLCSNGFSIEPELTAKIFKKKLRVYEVPISYYGRRYDEGKKITWRHGISAMLTLLKYRFVD